MIAPAAYSPSPLAKFFAEGELISVLTEAQQGDPPKVWLLPAIGGTYQISYTKKEHGMGSDIVPSLAVANGKILRSKVQSILDFLKSFGLLAQEAEWVVTTVGIIPV